jgi:hypothetical protein
MLMTQMFDLFNYSLISMPDLTDNAKARFHELIINSHTLPFLVLSCSLCCRIAIFSATFHVCNEVTVWATVNSVFWVNFPTANSTVLVYRFDALLMLICVCRTCAASRRKSIEVFSIFLDLQCKFIYIYGDTKKILAL